MSESAQENHEISARTTNFWNRHLSNFTSIPVVTVDPGSNPDHDKLGGEIGKLSVYWGEGHSQNLQRWH